MRRRHWLTLGAILALIFGGGTYVATHPNHPAEPHLSPSASASRSPVGGDPCQGGALCVLNPAVTQATIRITICVSGWTATVRPPASYTTPLKTQQMATLHLPGSPTDYEEDHRVPLELGGNPTDARNLTPELRAAAGGRAESKDSDENAARASVCSGSKTLAHAQADFVTKWLTSWPGYRST